MQSLVLITLSRKFNSKINLRNLVYSARSTRTNFTKKFSDKFFQYNLLF